MHTFVTVVHIMTCVLLVLVVLIQSGKGAEISASFSGSSQTVFGSSGGANFFTHFTQGAAAVFFCTSLALTVMSSQSRKSLFEIATPATSQIPVKQDPATAGAPAVPPPAGSSGAPAAGLKQETAPQSPAKTGK